MKVAVTGHRPIRLFSEFCYSTENYNSLVQFCTRLVNHHYTQNPNVIFLTGMALGFDMAIAEACKELGVPYHAYLPFKGQETRWRHHQQVKYQDLLNHASEVILVNDTTKYVHTLMFVRNHRMVIDSQELVVLWDGEPKGGTHECVTFAHNYHLDTKGYKITNIWGNWISWKERYNLR